VGDFLTVMGVCQLRTMRPFMGHPRWDEIDPVLRAIVDAAQSTTAEELVRVFDRFHRMNLTLIDLFHEARILVTPTCAGIVPLAGQGEGTVNGVVTPNWVQFTYPFNMTRSPAATVCAGLNSDGLPVGLQLVGPQHADLVVLRTAAALEAGLLAGRGHELLAPVEAAP
jgi:aspartyl-tRNA(Asn)/glutamyl-tRNA(Gln) amidotransferase subunit A